MEAMMRAVVGLSMVLGCTESVSLLEPLERVALEEMRWKGEAPSDPTNAYFDDAQAQSLGKALFYDRRLSANGELSCGSCHQPELGFADGRVIAEGIGVAARHTPTLMGAAHQDWYLWDGGCDSLWCQGVGPMENPSEMAFTRSELAHLLNEDPDYRERYEAIFGALPNLDDKTRFPEVARPNWSDEESTEHLAWVGMTESDQVALNRVLTNAMKSLGAFQGRIDRVGSAFDMFGEAVVEDNPIGQALYDRDALAGFKLFVGKAGCVACHSGRDSAMGNLTTAAWVTVSGSLNRMKAGLRAFSMCLRTRLMPLDTTAMILSEPVPPAWTRWSPSKLSVGPSEYRA